MGKQLNTGRTHFPKGHIPWNKGVKTGKSFGKPFIKGQVPWNKKPEEKRICEGCGIEFIRKNGTKGKYHIYECYWKSLKGKKNESKTKFKKGQMPWNMGKLQDNPTYSSIHKWVYRTFEKYNKCDFCGTIKARTFEWANKSGEYKRLREDWFRLCKSCHVIYDKKRKKQSASP